MKDGWKNKTMWTFIGGAATALAGSSAIVPSGARMPTLEAIRDSALTISARFDEEIAEVDNVEELDGFEEIDDIEEIQDLEEEA